MTLVSILLVHVIGFSSLLTVEILSAATIRVTWNENDIDISSSVNYECTLPQSKDIVLQVEKSVPYTKTSTNFNICFYNNVEKYKHTVTLLQKSENPSKEPTLISKTIDIGNITGYELTLISTNV